MQRNESEGARSNPVRVARTGRVLPIEVGGSGIRGRCLMVGRVPSGSCCGSVGSTPVGADFVAGACQIEIGSAAVRRKTILTGDDHARGRASRRGCRGVDQQGWQAQRRHALEARRQWAFVVHHGAMHSRLSASVDVRHYVIHQVLGHPLGRLARAVGANKPGDVTIADRGAGLMCASPSGPLQRSACL